MSFKAMVFIAVLLTCLLLQKSFSWRIDQRKGHWYWKSFGSHILLAGIGNGLIRFFQFLGVGTNVFLLESQGPLNVNLLPAQPPLLTTIICIMLLDFAIYWQHRLVHKVPFLWRFHRVHHSDQKMETTSGIRFHPVEIFFSHVYKLSICWTFHVTLENYILFELILMSSSLFNHSNLALPKWLEKFISPLVVTPRVHHVHHSIERGNMSTNFGFFLTLWDRIFGSFKKLPEETLLSMPLGVRNSSPVGAMELLRDPFVSKH